MEGIAGEGATGRMVLGSRFLSLFPEEFPMEVLMPCWCRVSLRMPGKAGLRVCGSRTCQTRTLIQLRSLPSLVPCGFPHGPPEAGGRRAFLPLSTQHQGDKQKLCEARVDKELGEEPGDPALCAGYGLAHLT